LSDCDVIINLALAGGTPREIANAEAALIENSCRFAPGRTVIYFSSVMVAGDPRPGVRLRRRSPYGACKLRSERIAKRAAARYKNPLYILRLGHVCGELQNFSLNIREEVRREEVALPSPQALSNTVDVATIADAVQSIIAGRQSPGTYDLMNVPEWSWRKRYEHEAARAGVSLRWHSGGAIAAGRNSSPVRSLIGGVAGLATVPGLRTILSRLAACLPRWINDRGQAWWFLRRARAEIAIVRASEAPADHLSWVPLGSVFLKGLTPTEKLLSEAHNQIPAVPADNWAADLADACVDGRKATTQSA